MYVEKSNNYPFHKDWIDNLKFLGIFLIVTGHCGLDLKDYFRPNSLEALGVAPFFLILGYNLAKSNKTKCEIFVSRLFKLFFWGIIAAITDSVISYYILNNFVESNFLPFIFGVNCFFISAPVPGNPVLWYIGAYTHFIILFLLFPKMPRINFKIIFVLFCFEILMRLGDGIVYDSYTFFLNWICIFTLGICIAQNEEAIIKIINFNKAKILIPAFILLPLLMYILNNSYLPFAEGGRFLLVTSVLFVISVVIRSNSFIHLIATNTLIIFLFHHIIIDYMPYGLSVPAIVLESIILIILLAFASEIANRIKWVDGIEEIILRKIRS